MTDPDLLLAGFSQAEWDAAVPWPEHLAAIEEKRSLWESWARRARIEDDARARLEALPGRRRVLVLTEAWCGDAARSVPALAAAFDLAGDVEHRYLDVEAHPEVMDRFLTHGGRAVPMVVVQDEHGRLLGVWGPRPAPLQAMLRARIRTEGRPGPDDVAAFYAPIMGWYGTDGGRTVVEEILMILERGG
jgi:hypothetical protein